MAVTAHNIQTHELLYRLGLAAHVVVTLTNVPMAVIFYDLFKVVNRRLALLDLFFALVATAVEAAGMLNDFTSAILLGGGALHDRYSTGAAARAGVPARRSVEDRLHRLRGVLRL